MKVHGRNYNYFLRLYNYAADCSATIVRFNSYYKVIFHDDIHQPKEKDFHEINNALIYLMVDCGYKFMSGSVHLKQGSLE